MNSNKIIVCAIVAAAVVWLYISYNKNATEIAQNRERSTKQVPLEYSNIDLSESNPSVLPTSIRLENEITNDPRTRMEFARSGDLDWFHYLHNIPQDDRLAPLGTFYEHDGRISNFDGALYDPSYHNDGIIGN